MFPFRWRHVRRRSVLVLHELATSLQCNSRQGFVHIIGIILFPQAFPCHRSARLEDPSLIIGHIFESDVADREAVAEDLGEGDQFARAQIVQSTSICHCTGQQRNMRIHREKCVVAVRLRTFMHMSFGCCVKNLLILCTHHSA